LEAATKKIKNKKIKKIKIKKNKNKWPKQDSQIG
jgi:hypothetical protein